MLTNAIEEMHDISEFSLNISTKSLCNINAEFVTPEKLTTKQDKSENMLKMEDIVNDIPNKANVLDICETIEAGIENNDNNINKTKQPRRSIGDLLERYKKLVEVHNRTSKISYVDYDNKEL